MSFRELLERYRSGRATPEERALVEQELEKSAAIADYLAEELEAGLEPPAEGVSAPEVPEAGQVRRTMNRRLARVAVLTAALLLAGCLVVFYVVSPIAASFCYQPNGAAGQHGGKNISVDLDVIYEVTHPDLKPRLASAKDRGFGNYELFFIQSDLFTGEEQELTWDLPGNGAGRMRQDYKLWRLTRSDPDPEQAEGMALQAEEISTRALAELEVLPESAWVSAWVVFPQELEMDALVECYDCWNRAYPGDLTIAWTAVRTQDEMWTDVMGFRSEFGGYGHAAAPDRERYPLLNLNDMYGDHNPVEYREGEAGPAALLHRKSDSLTLHFQSMLRYLADHPQMTAALGGTSDMSQWDFQSALEYVEANGIRMYAALIFAAPETLTELHQSGEVSLISIENVLPSRYSAAGSYIN